jgi:hypothetical protein
LERKPAILPTESESDSTPEEANRRAKELAHRLLNTPPKPRPNKAATKPVGSKLPTNPIEKDISK